MHPALYPALAVLLAGAVRKAPGALMVASAAVLAPWPLSLAFTVYYAVHSYRNVREDVARLAVPKPPLR